MSDMQGGFNPNMPMQPPYQSGNFGNNGYNGYDNFNGCNTGYPMNGYGNNPPNNNSNGFMPTNQNYSQNNAHQPQSVIGQSNVNWAAGIDDVKRIQLAANCNYMLLDGNTDGLMYIKSCDNIGKPHLQYFKYTEITEQDALEMINENHSQFATKEEVREIKEMIANLAKSNGGEDNGKQSVSSAKSSK